MANTTILLKEIADKLKLVNLTPELDLTEVKIQEAEVNRTALQLTGYFGHFDANRLQIIGNVEFSYLSHLTQPERLETYIRLFEQGIPCLVFARGLKPCDPVIEKATEFKIPILQSKRGTSELMAEVIRFLGERLAPCITIHGVLVDVYGVGVLITGESGVGKSEAALELIRRGHRLVTDDVVEIRKISDDKLVGKSPEITKSFIELRGIGIINVQMLFGVECIKQTKNIDMEIKLVEWEKRHNYDRLGSEEEYSEYLGNKILCQSIPIRPGRNLAVICETAAANYRQKKMGYNSTKEFYKRVQQSFKN
ncbi:Hpr(Ser) kinase/phosphatase [Acetitomaculum ruminis DSM 5522]|uniref:HPr kinase/phosphorylase n=1 Tax=Acetitomaculum ruminis DSM 5522 TaxID=1120918 RepID=A0A1I0XYZ8_9FIRM|nr:HPr(Ser) kinase/phosphatase [Acetitomaculum ruminis]SFB06245.1 Hpr(Ser) kinase/phosphatase [Acetitomaculum ruminis DSM 5522]